MGYVVPFAFSAFLAIFVTWFLHRRLSKQYRWLVVGIAGLTPLFTIWLLMIWFNSVGYNLSIWQACVKIISGLGPKDYALFAVVAVGGLAMSFAVSVQFGRFASDPGAVKQTKE